MFLRDLIQRLRTDPQMLQRLLQILNVRGYTIWLQVCKRERHQLPLHQSPRPHRNTQPFDMMILWSKGCKVLPEK